MLVEKTILTFQALFRKAGRGKSGGAAGGGGRPSVGPDGGVGDPPSGRARPPSILNRPTACCVVGGNGRNSLRVKPAFAKIDSSIRECVGVAAQVVASIRSEAGRRRRLDAIGFGDELQGPRRPPGASGECFAG